MEIGRFTILVYMRDMVDNDFHRVHQPVLKIFIATILLLVIQLDRNLG
jgi:hypothetical protein